VTYQVGVIAPSSPVLQHSSLRRFGDNYLTLVAAHEIENLAGHELAYRLLADLVGGKAGKNVRDQFA